MIPLNNLLVGPVARLPWRVQTKLLAAFLAIVALLIALGAIGLYELSAVNQRTEELIKSERKIAAYRQGQQPTTSPPYRTSMRIFCGFHLGAILLALILGRTISLSLIGPIREIDARLSEIASGDFTQRVRVGNRDEVGALAANVNRMSEQLGDLYQQLE